MPPKNEKDELDTVKGDLQARDLQILFGNDKATRLEERAHVLGNMIKETEATSQARDRALEDLIASLTYEAREFERRSEENEMIILKMKQERAESHAALLAELIELKATHKVQHDELQGELDDAHHLIMAVKEFKLKQGSIEKEIEDLKAMLAKEKRDHQEALSDVERVSFQEKEKLRKEMLVRIEETRIQTMKQVEEQLHIKTKRTIAENERLGREVAYHIRQTDLLARKNSQTHVDNMELEQKMQAARDLEDDLARKNHCYQKAARILLFKLQEQHLAANVEAIEELEELKQLVSFNEKITTDIQQEQQDLERVKAIIEEKTRTAEESGAAEEAVKFLYLALEDVELEELADVDGETSILDDVPEFLAPDANLDKLSIQDRQTFLTHLLRTAVSLRLMMQKALASKTGPEGRPGSFGAWSHVLYEGREDRPKVSAEDVLAFQIDVSKRDHFPPARRSSCGVQTDPRPLDEMYVLSPCPTNGLEFSETVYSPPPSPKFHLDE